MVGGVQHDDVMLPGVGAGQLQRQVVRLRPRVHEEDAVEAAVGREERQDLLGVARAARVQVPGVGVDVPQLSHGGLDQAGVRMAHVRHVVHAVQVAPARLVEHELALAAHQAERVVVVEERELGEHVLPADVHHLPQHRTAGISAPTQIHWWRGMLPVAMRQVQCLLSLCIAHSPPGR